MSGTSPAPIVKVTVTTSPVVVTTAEATGLRVAVTPPAPAR